MLACAMTLAFGATAQESETIYYPEYPQYNCFSSNLSFGIYGQYNWQYDLGTPIEWIKATNAGLGIFAEKELNYVWSLRGMLDVNGLFTDEDIAAPKFDRAGKVLLGAKLSLNDAWRGYYNPDRKWSWYLHLSEGLGVLYQNNNLGYIQLYAEAGTGVSWKACEHSTFFAEYAFGIFADPANFFQGWWHDEDGALRIGWMYNLGPAQADLDAIEQRKMLTQENFDKLAAQNEQLTKDLQSAKEREQKLINRIHQLEEANNDDDPGNIRILKNNSQLVDSLRQVIEGYEKNKDNFYAMPFSILYDLDSYTVSADQLKKVQAIAKVMKNNEDFNIEVVGYCDASGSDAYNQKLSEKRAEGVKKLLVKYGVDEDRISTSGKGKTVAFGDLKDSINRRVSFYRTNK